MIEHSSRPSELPKSSSILHYWFFQVHEEKSSKILLKKITEFSLDE